MAFTFFRGTSLARGGWGATFIAWRVAAESNGADLASLSRIQECKKKVFGA